MTHDGTEPSVKGLSGSRLKASRISEHALPNCDTERQHHLMAAVNLASDRDRAGVSLLTLERSFAILDAIAATPASRGLGHATLARQLGFQRSTLYRYLATLEQLGLVEADRGTHRYRLGKRLLVLGSAALGERPFTRYTKEFVNELAAATGETAHAAVYHAGCSVTVDIADGAGPIGPRISIGSRRPAHCSASGKVFLAFQPGTLLEEYLMRPLERRTPSTIVTADELRQHLGLIRRQGFAPDNAECAPGVCCIAAPVLDFRGHVAGSLCISIAAGRLLPEQIHRLLKPLLRAVHAFSSELGYPSFPQATDEPKALNG
jgi:IclR family KDG regulon transcriptional repressor